MNKDLVCQNYLYSQFQILLWNIPFLQKQHSWSKSLALYIDFPFTFRWVATSSVFILGPMHHEYVLFDYTFACAANVTITNDEMEK